MTEPTYRLAPPIQIQLMKSEPYYELVVAAYELGISNGIRHANIGLKEQALAEVTSAVKGGNITPERGAIICRALERIDE